MTCVRAFAIGLASLIFMLWPLEALKIERDRDRRPPPMSTKSARLACPLPVQEEPGAAWCTHESGYVVATYGSGGPDIVSNGLCRHHKWEYSAPRELGGLPVELTAPSSRDQRIFLDVGGNIGTWSFAFAKNGYTVVAVEAKTSNVKLFKASLCANPDVADNVTVVHAILRDEPSPGVACHICDSGNGGNGGTYCSDDDRTEYDHTHSHPQCDVDVPVKTLDEIVDELGIKHVDVMKLDIEGYEFLAMKGGRSKLLQGAVKPRYIVTEIQFNRPSGNMYGATPVEYADMLRSFGYKFHGTTKQGFGGPEDSGSPPADGKLHFFVLE